MDFKAKREYIKNNKKIEIEHFDNVKEITSMIDFINKEAEENNKKRADEEIGSISRFLADHITKKIYFMGNKK